jgi:hypothetical protein
LSEEVRVSTGEGGDTRLIVEVVHDEEDDDDIGQGHPSD